MISVRKRGKKFFADLFANHQRIRGPLGTRSQEVVRRLVHQLEIAMAEGMDSNVWTELQQLLPGSTFTRFSEFVGVKPKVLPTWEDLKAAFALHRSQQIKLGKMAQATSDRYEFTVREFGEFLRAENITQLKDISRPVVERFKVRRIENINRKKFARGGTSLALDAAILHRVFSFGLDNELIQKNPVRMEGRPGENPSGGAEPFTAEQLGRMRENAGADLLAFLLLRWTGFRGIDAVKITWQEVSFEHKEIERVTQKRKKRVILPMHTELVFALETEFEKLRPALFSTVLLNPVTATKMSRPGLYRRIVALGNRSGVPGAHPHRFRDTLAVDMLARGASPYDVAKMLGDTIDTIEKHYTPFVKELRARVRNILEIGSGLEELSVESARTDKKFN